MRLCNPNGKLILIGGGEDKEKDCFILKEFLRLAGGAQARVAVMTAATDFVEEVGSSYVEVFGKLGAAAVDIVDVSTRVDASAGQSLSLIERATGIFFTGGDQLHITALLGGTRMDDLIHRKFEEGTVLAGTSAGAAMMSSVIILGGEPQTNPRLGGADMGPGEEFLERVIIDTHFSQRGRHGRLLTAVAQYPQVLGIGIDEDTAIAVSDNVFRVLGRGAITIIDAGAATYTNLPELKKGQGIALYDFKIHILTAGHGFDMEARTPLHSLPGQAQPFIERRSPLKDYDRRRGGN